MGTLQHDIKIIINWKNKNSRISKKFLKDESYQVLKHIMKLE